MSEFIDNKNIKINADIASKIIIQPYVTEKTFNIIEKENKLSFIVHSKAKKKHNNRIYEGNL